VLFFEALLIEGVHYRWQRVERPPFGKTRSNHSMLAIKNRDVSNCTLRVQEEDKTEGGQEREKLRARGEGRYLNSLSGRRSRNSRAMTAMVCNRKRGGHIVRLAGR
jgi:hypothetical protein